MALLLSAGLPNPKKFIPPPAKKSMNVGEAVRALRTWMLTVGKTRSPGVQLLVDEYSEKLRWYVSIDVLQIRSNPKKVQDTKAQIREEDIAVMSTIGTNNPVVLLDENGKDLRFEEMLNS